MNASTGNANAPVAPNLTEARRLHALGYPLVKLHAYSKRPVGLRWNKNPATEIDPEATGYGLILAAADPPLASIDPDDARRSKKALAALGFDLATLMACGVQTASTRPGSGGRSAFLAPPGVRWLKFCIGQGKRRRIVLELRADRPNLQDCVPGVVYRDDKGRLCTQRYVNGRGFDDAGPMPADFVAWWQRCSTDPLFWAEQKGRMCEALGVDYVVEPEDHARSGRLPYTRGCTVDFNAKHTVETLLARYGYHDHGNGRWSAPNATGAPGVRRIPGHESLWYSSHGSDLMSELFFDAWSLYVVYEHDCAADTAQRAYERKGMERLAKVLPRKARDVPRETPAPEPSGRRLPGDLPDTFMAGDLRRMAIPPTRWLVDGLIAPGFTLIAAPPKMGKSYLALQMGMCVSAGRPFLDRETTKSKVCYFDLEEWHALLLSRLDPISKGNSIPESALNERMKIRLTMGVGPEALAQIAQEIVWGAKLIIIDLFARIRGELAEDAKQNAYARDYKAIATLADFALLYPDVAILVVHHGNKGVHDEWQAKISGSYGLAGATHANMFMATPDLRGMDSADKEHAMSYRVLYASGKMVEEQELCIEKMPMKGGWQRSLVRPWEIGATLKQRRLLLILHQRHPAYMTAKELADLTGSGTRHYNAVRQMLYQMADQGTIESDGQGGAGYRARR